MHSNVIKKTAQIDNYLVSFTHLVIPGSFMRPSKASGYFSSPVALDSIWTIKSEKFNGGSGGGKGPVTQGVTGIGRCYTYRIRGNKWWDILCNAR